MDDGGTTLEGRPAVVGGLEKGVAVRSVNCPGVLLARALARGIGDQGLFAERQLQGPQSVTQGSGVL